MRLTILLIILVLSVVLAVQNADVVTLSFFAWRLEASLAVVIILCIVAGAMIAALALAPEIYRRGAEQRRLRRQLADLGHEPQLNGRSEPPATAPSSMSAPRKGSDE